MEIRDYTQQATAMLESLGTQRDQVSIGCHYADSWTGRSDCEPSHGIVYLIVCTILLLRHNEQQ